ncbi:hypothetical protein PHMEG_00026401 [Phytophthora megakarya]|uniref:Uncharacterized protein n=1 Tax=Phytophthora megakarya TaxID=4795 RepID=A0A225VBD8_9STRA|nr:hypothetical protein PHMEG_00026401 [Phytophthora megakarya]
MSHGGTRRSGGIPKTVEREKSGKVPANLEHRTEGRVHPIKALCLGEVSTKLEATAWLTSRGLVKLPHHNGKSVKKVKCAPRQLATFDGSHFQVTQRITFNSTQLRTIARPLRLCNTQPGYLSTIGEIFACTIAACNRTPREWDLHYLGRERESEAVNLIRGNSFLGATCPDNSELRVATPEFVDNKPDIVTTILEDCVAEATNAGVGATGVEQLRTVSFGRDPPVRVEPLRARLSEGVLPVRRSARRYSPAHMKYLENHVNEIIDNGLALGGYQSPPRIVSKRKTGV